MKLMNDMNILSIINSFSRQQQVMIYRVIFTITTRVRPIYNIHIYLSIYKTKKRFHLILKHKTTVNQQQIPFQFTPIKKYYFDDDPHCKLNITTQIKNQKSG